MSLQELLASPILLYQFFITACLFVLFGILSLNLVDVKRLLNGEPSVFPFVSILVPARNEARSIEACVRSLCTQSYPNFEVIVLNDHSTDETGEILLRLQSEFATLRVLSGKDLPQGWVGKCWACFQLSEHAQGELLLFTDADTVHSPDALCRAVRSMEETHADMLSLVPYQTLGSFWENVIVPLVHFLIMCLLPMRMIWQSNLEAFSFANGQFILFRRAMYERIGGHQAVKSNIVEDVWFVKATKRAGGKVMVFNGVDAVQCRMYHGLHEAFSGFSKNLFAGLGYNAVAMIAICGIMFLWFVMPIFFALFAVLFGEISLEFFWLPLVQMFLAVLMRSLIAIKFRLNMAYSLLHILSIVMFIAIALNSMRWIYFGGGAAWKGRRYNFSKLT
ncbi:MAG: glycosyltransferase [Chloroherpetonaceae bacterium]